ncbi:putative cytokinetic ring protein SteA [Bacillus horti]|uniref:Membrane-anchored protein n=1 Tax=Caldalkalibacillus horti TaxID=77523 RepID=A0ABT9W0V9_9BACI|nr:putative cytokinetic ring protein SteA [Bacillus horti]MDQ0166861.1 putative membrane-anchored protein [Bacillus horti]
MLKIQPSHTTLSGAAYFNPKTKKLVQYIPPQSIAVIQHKDIDELAAKALIYRKVKAVVNIRTSMSGEYMSSGTSLLLKQGIPVFDVLSYGEETGKNKELKNYISEQLRHGEVCIINDLYLYKLQNGRSVQLAKLLKYTEEIIQLKRSEADLNSLNQLQQFAENTLFYAKRDMEDILKPILLPNIHTLIENKHVVVVTRGKGYLEDLLAIRPYIERYSPVLIGVDGGADALLDCGLTPDLIIGDMDSVSSSALQSGAELVVHTYANGRGPGVEEMSSNGVNQYVSFPCLGTSEDAAYLLAYEAGAEKIVAIGSHTSMHDFLEKGREGMGSTFLIRLKIGNKLVDGKGIRFLFAEEAL